MQLCSSSLLCESRRKMCQRVIQELIALKLRFYRGTKHGLWQQSPRAAFRLLPQLPLRRQIAIERIAVHTQGLADVGDEDRSILHQRLSSLELVLRHDPRPASLAAPRPSGGSDHRPFLDWAPLIFGQRSKHLKHQSSLRGCRVHLFRERDRLHALGLQNIDKAQQVAERLHPYVSSRHTTSTSSRRIYSQSRRNSGQSAQATEPQQVSMKMRSQPD